MQTNEVFAIRKRRKTFAVEMDALARSSDIQRSFLSGAADGTRTRTEVKFSGKGAKQIEYTEP